MKKITIKQLCLIFLTLLLVQFIVLGLSKENKLIGYETKKVIEEFKKENPGVMEKILISSNSKLENELNLEIAKKVFLEECLRIMLDYRIRNAISSSDDKMKEYIILEKEIEINKIKETDLNSYKIIELEHEIKVIKNGYNFISFIMEKILKMDSIKILKNQSNYFYVIITMLVFVILIGYKLFKKLKD